MLDQETMKAQANAWTGWWLEILLCHLGLCCFAVIIVVLKLYDQQVPPDWPLQITINSFLALFSTLCKACFMVALAETISQWKWNIFEGIRPLIEFEIVDSASRGFWGSVQLVMRFKHRHPIALAGIVSILSSLTSPITQQALKFDTRPKGDFGRSRVDITHHWHGFAQDIHGQNVALGQMNQAIANGQFSVEPEPLRPFCPTANCSFNSYSSLALCVKIQDVGEFLMVDREPFNLGSFNLTLYRLTLPNDLSAEILHRGHNALSGNSSLVFADDEAYPSTVANYFLVYTSQYGAASDSNTTAKETEPDFNAYEILFYLCVNEYETVVSSHESNTNIIRSSSVVVPTAGGEMEVPKQNCQYPFITSIELHCDGFELSSSKEWGNMTLSGATNNASLLSEDTNEVFSFDVGTAIPLSTSLNYALFSCGYHKDDARLAFCASSSQWLTKAIWGPGLDDTDRGRQAERIGLYFEGIATAVSNYIRSGNGSASYPGTAWSQEIFVSIRWGWLGFLGGETLLASAFVIFTVVATHHAKVPVLKSSAIAGLLAADSGTQTVLGTILDLDDAINQAASVRVRRERKALVPADVAVADANLADGIWKSGKGMVFGGQGG